VLQKLNWMDDTIRTTIEGTTETTYVQQMPAHNQQAMVQNAAPVAPVMNSCCRRK
jgi:acetyl-CoA carboxylase biotin carboxyl carrier protein